MWQRTTRISWVLALAVLGMDGPHAAQAKSLVIGGFNDSRGGQASLADPAKSGLASAIMAQFPGVAFHLANHLSAHQLTGADVVFLGVISSPTSGIKPLSKTEQSVLLSFVQHGGTAVLFTDNDTFASNGKAVNSSLLKPFSLAATGTLDGSEPIALQGTANPVASGPAGTITQLDTFYPGWFSKLGSAALLGKLTANSKPGLAWLPAGTLGAGSGPVIFFADCSLVLDQSRSSENTTGILNAIAVGAP